MLSSIGWYLDRADPLCQGTCQVGYAYISTWRELYGFDPSSAAIKAGADPSSVARLMLGGELASWGESVDEANMDSRVWSRGVAVAERLWSPAALTVDPLDAVARLASWRCKARRIGLNVGDTGPSWCDLHEPQRDAAPSNTAESPTWLRVALIVLIVLGVLMLVALVVVSVVLAKRRHATQYTQLK